MPSIDISLRYAKLVLAKAFVITARDVGVGHGYLGRYLRMSRTAVSRVVNGHGPSNPILVDHLFTRLAEVRRDYTVPAGSFATLDTLL